jgi:TPP-dependent pyruvate/acetoin dehydrogenase alpha subunit
MTQDDVDRLAAEVKTSLEDAVKYAQDAPYPDPETVGEGVWAD